MKSASTLPSVACVNISWHCAFGDISINSRTLEIFPTYVHIPITEAHSSTQSTPVNKFIWAGVVSAKTKMLTSVVVIITFSIAFWNIDDVIIVQV